MDVHILIVYVQKRSLVCKVKVVKKIRYVAAITSIA